MKRRVIVAEPCNDGWAALAEKVSHKENVRRLWSRSMTVRLVVSELDRQRWSWSVSANPDVSTALAASECNSDWCYGLEASAAEAVTGKVICVVIAIAIAREHLQTQFQLHRELQEGLRLLDFAESWVDNPTNETFEQIEKWLFDSSTSVSEDGPLRTTWGVLRAVTSAPGCKEAAWALAMVVDDAKAGGLDVPALARKSLTERSTF